MSKTETSVVKDVGLDAPSFNLPPLELQPHDARPETTDCYQLNDLLRYHDRAFVAHTAAAIRRRALSPAEFARTLDDLRAGRQSKIEIIERMCAGQTLVQVVGLPSPAMRRVSRWPLIGYLLRLLRGVARLPLLMQHQQQFESYALAQQQRIADYLNETLTPAVMRQAGAVSAVRLQPQELSGDIVTELTTTINDAAESIFMLSDSLVELSERHAAMQMQVEKLQAQQGSEQTQREDLQAQQRAVQRQMEELRAQLEEFQTQQRSVQAQLRADIAALNATLSTQQGAWDQARRS